MTLTEMVHNYHKKNGLAYHFETYVHRFKDGSTIQFMIDSAEKEVELRDPDDHEKYSANILTKQFMVTTKTDKFSRLEWFEGRRFRTIQSAIKAIQKDLKGQ